MFRMPANKVDKFEPDVIKEFTTILNRNIEKHTLSDEWGNVNVFMLPFIKPVNVRQAFPDEEINSYTDAVSCALGHISLDESERNVILSHQFVTGAIKSDSEETVSYTHL